MMSWIPAGFAAVVLAFGIPMLTPMPAEPVCLHGPDETAVQAARRTQAVRFARQINSEQLKAFQSSKTYLTLEQLAANALPEGFNLRLAADAKGYAFSVVDQSDPCKLAYFSNEAGLIYKGEPLQ